MTKLEEISHILFNQISGMGYVKVAHHTWIKFLKSRRNSSMMKNKVTYDVHVYMNVQKANEKSFFGKNMTFKNLFQELLTKVSGGFELRTTVHKTNALDH